MNRTFYTDLQKWLQDPEFAAGFTEAQIESGKELLRCGVIKSFTYGSQSGKTKHSKWKIDESKA